MNNHLKKLGWVLFALFIISCSGYGEKLVYDGTEVYYKEGVSEDLARKTGAYLQEMGFTDGTTKSVQLTKDSVHHFRMVVQDQYATDTSMDINFEALAFLLSEEVFDGENIRFELCNNTFKTLREIPVHAAGE
ncbi:MAG: hypothetical protein R2793_04445 [Flavobacteriaceae bacterium]